MSSHNLKLDDLVLICLHKAIRIQPHVELQNLAVSIEDNLPDNDFHEDIDVDLKPD